jgi:hypothetical protein
VVSQTPSRIDFRAYNVGFGDCLLLSFTYDHAIDGRAERHVLIDYGTNKKATGGPELAKVADLIKADTHDKLDVLVLTHRHRDHMSGFDPDSGGKTIASLEPDAVVRPWTEVPDARTAAGGAGAVAPTALAPGATVFTPGQRRLLDILEAGHRFAEGLGESLKASLEAAESGRLSAAGSALREVAAMQVRNAEAIAQLDDIASRGAASYLRFGDPLALDMLPGVSISVLGPPDPDQWPAILGQAEQSVEYWLGAGSADPAALAASAAKTAIEVEGEAASLLAPGPGRWLIDRLDDHLFRSAERLVHQLDGVLNNTSLVLLVEAGGHRLLLSGDAEIENWGYALTGAPDHEAICERLRGVDLWKVGHHGSRNATPKKSLFPEVQKSPSPCWAVMSTLEGFYDKTNPVPNQALVDQLSLPPFTLLRTDKIDKPKTVKAIHLAATGSGPFAVAD